MERKRKTRAEAHFEEAVKSIQNFAYNTEFPPIDVENFMKLKNYLINDIQATASLCSSHRYRRILPEIDRLIYSGNKTIIIWKDGDKTIVSCGEGEQFDQYTGFCAAVVKKVFGSTTAAKKVMNTLKKDCN